MISTLMALDVNWMAYQIISCAHFARHDLEGECFLKVQDSGRVMKSETVPFDAPQALPYDWRMR